MGSDGPVALNMLSIEQAMNDYKIDEDERIEFSLKVRQIANIIFTAIAKEREEEMKRIQKT